jgi:hypothetical protein
MSLMYSVLRTGRPPRSAEVDHITSPGGGKSEEIRRITQLE